MPLLGGHYHCVKVSSDSETVRGMGLWDFFCALKELMLSSCPLITGIPLCSIGTIRRSVNSVKHVDIFMLIIIE